MCTIKNYFDKLSQDCSTDQENMVRGQSLCCESSLEFAVKVALSLAMLLTPIMCV